MKGQNSQWPMPENH